MNRESVSAVIHFLLFYLKCTNSKFNVIYGIQTKQFSKLPNICVYFLKILCYSILEGNGLLLFNFSFKSSVWADRWCGTQYQFLHLLCFYYGEKELFTVYACLCKIYPVFIFGTMFYIRFQALCYHSIKIIHSKFGKYFLFDMFYLFWMKLYNGQIVF